MNPERTSDTHPIMLCPIEKVWQVPLFITFAPGKVQNDAMTGTWNRSLSQDLARIKNFYQVDVLVCLLEQEEMKELKIPNLLAEATKLGITTQWIPIQDNTAPKQDEEYKKLVKKVVEEYLKKGRKVVVHCKGGLGRAGTFAGACLIYEKWKAQEAIALVRKVRNNSINCLSQQKWLKNVKF